MLVHLLISALYNITSFDFGDSWEHEILIEKILPADPGAQYPVCFAGKRAREHDGVAWWLT